MPGLEVPVPPALFAGPILIGALLAYLLFGVLLVQVFQFVQNASPHDRPAIRGLVALVTLIQFVALVFITQITWYTCVEAFLDPLKLILPPVTAPSTPIMNGIISLVVQCFFAWKIRSLAPKSKIVLVAATLIVSLSVMQFGASIGIGVNFLLINRNVQQMFKLKRPITIHLTSTVACDTLITASMVSILFHYKDNTSFVKTKSLLNTLIINTIENGLITTVTAIGNLMVFFLRTGDMINITFQYVIGGLYAIVLLTTLNRRKPARRNEGPSARSISLSDAEGFASNPRSGSSRPPYSVNVIRTMDEHDLKTRPDVMISVSTETHKDSIHRK